MTLASSTKIMTRAKISLLFIFSSQYNSNYRVREIIQKAITPFSLS
jgi:hypothetical protein